jgi:hypothetical protein
MQRFGFCCRFHPANQAMINKVFKSIYKEILPSSAPVKTS